MGSDERQKEKRHKLDPESAAILKASIERNRKALERLAKL